MILLVAPALAVVTLLSRPASSRILNPDDAAIPLSSDAGLRLLSLAAATNPHRALDENNNNGNDRSWIANYDVKYTGCSSYVDYGDNVDGDGNEKSGVFVRNLVKFSLCPTDSSCSTCHNGGEYVVDMYEFLDTYFQLKTAEQEEACDSFSQECNCDGSEYCMNECYKAHGMGFCIDEYADFDVENYLVCGELDDDNDGNNGNNGNYNNNYYQNADDDDANQEQYVYNSRRNYYYNMQDDEYIWYGKYYLGPYCSASDSWSIHLGVFYDEDCRYRADDSIYQMRHNGYRLPFSRTSFVHGECFSCLDYNNNNGNNNGYYYNQQLQVNELCDALYEESARCETNLDVYGKDESGCEYLDRIAYTDEYTRRHSSWFQPQIGGGNGLYIRPRDIWRKTLGMLAAFFFLTTLCLIAYITTKRRLYFQGSRSNKKHATLGDAGAARYIQYMDQYIDKSVDVCCPAGIYPPTTKQKKGKKGGGRGKDSSNKQSKTKKTAVAAHYDSSRESYNEQDRLKSISELTQYAPEYYRNNNNRIFDERSMDDTTLTSPDFENSTNTSSTTNGFEMLIA